MLRDTKGQNVGGRDPARGHLSNHHDQIMHDYGKEQQASRLVLLKMSPILDLKIE